MSFNYLSVQISFFSILTGHKHNWPAVCAGTCYLLRNLSYLMMKTSLLSSYNAFIYLLQSMFLISRSYRFFIIFNFFFFFINILPRQSTILEIFCASCNNVTSFSFTSILQILVVFCGTDEIRKAVIRVIFQQINIEGLHRLILVLQSKMNSHARKVVDEYPIKVEFFQVSHL